MKKSIVTLIGIGLLLLAACAPSAPPTATPVPNPMPVPALESAEDLIGIWHETKPEWGEVYLQFKNDGTYRVATGAADRLENYQKVEGEFWFEGKQLFIKDIAGAPEWDVCVKPKQIVAKYEVQVLANLNLKFIEIEDECSDRADFIPGEYVPVP